MDNRAQILIIDDKPEECEALQSLLGDLPYNLNFANSGIEGIVRASTIHPDVILLEVKLPYIDGFDVCSLIRSHYALGEIPVLLMCNQGDSASRIAGLKAGADDFIVKPFDKLELMGRLQGVIRLNRYRLTLEQHRQIDRPAESRPSQDKDIEGWSRVLDMRDKETEGHTQRVTEMTLALGRAAGLDEDALKHIWRGSLLHDIGLHGIPDSILKKPGRLSEAEWQIMHEHPVYAYKWLSAVEYLRPALDIPYCHHEKWDGSGYPRGLKGEEIPLAARLFAIVDVWDALSSDRPYRAALPASEVHNYIVEQSGKHFDPHIVELFLKQIS
jgi:putative two-component system response regulator